MAEADDSEFLNVLRKQLEAVEKAADEVLLTRNTLIELDRKRQQLREAGRYVPQRDNRSFEPIYFRLST